MRTLVLGCLVLAATACDSADDTCSGALILPSESPKALGIFRPRGDGEPANPGAGIYPPYEWTLFLQNTCGQPLEISKVCIVGDGEGDAAAFTLEGPLPDKVSRGDAAAVRLTYAPKGVNPDADGDGERDANSIAIVVQSNAGNFPTLVVPVCAVVVPANEFETATYSCTSPVVVPAGKADRTLCK